MKGCLKRAAFFAFIPVSFYVFSLKILVHFEISIHQIQIIQFFFIGQYIFTGQTPFVTSRYTEI
jgi:hypothetical protein